MTEGFRVLRTRDARSVHAPRIVAYRLDPETLAITDIAGNAEALFGFSRDEWRRREFFHEHLHPDDRHAARDFCRAWAKDRRSHELQYRLVDAAGRVRWVHDILEVHRRADGTEEILGVLIDITQRIAGDSDISKALRLRDELLRIVAEGLAQPVRTIGAYGDMLGRHLATQRDDVGSDYAIGVREGVQRLDAVIGRLLRVAQSGTMSLDEMTESLAAIRSQTRGGE